MMSSVQNSVWSMQVSLIELYQMLGTCLILFAEDLPYLREQLIMSPYPPVLL